MKQTVSQAISRKNTFWWTHQWTIKDTPFLTLCRPTSLNKTTEVSEKIHGSTSLNNAYQYNRTPIITTALSLSNNFGGVTNNMTNRPMSNLTWWVEATVPSCTGLAERPVANSCLTFKIVWVILYRLISLCGFRLRKCWVSRYIERKLYVAIVQWFFNPIN